MLRYKILQFSDPIDLENSVAHMSSDGWRLFGDLKIVSYVSCTDIDGNHKKDYVQVMVSMDAIN